VIKKLIVPIIGSLLLVTLGAANCDYKDPGLPPHPGVSYPQTPLTGSDATYDPDINFGSAPAPLEGTKCTKSGQEKRDPGTGEFVRCVNKIWKRI